MSCFLNTLKTEQVDKWSRVLFALYALVAGYGNYAATVHDWLYTGQKYSRRECDEVLYRALRAEGVAKWRAWLFWAGVRLGGGRQYRL